MANEIFLGRQYAQKRLGIVYLVQRVVSEAMLEEVDNDHFSPRLGEKTKRSIARPFSRFEMRTRVIYLRPHSNTRNPVSLLGNDVP